MFIAVLFTVAKMWIQPKNLSTEEWIKKMGYIHTKEQYSAIRKDETVSFATTWLDLDNIMLSDMSVRKS